MISNKLLVDISCKRILHTNHAWHWGVRFIGSLERHKHRNILTRVEHWIENPLRRTSKHNLRYTYLNFSSFDDKWIFSLLTLNHFLNKNWIITDRFWCVLFLCNHRNLQNRLILKVIRKKNAKSSLTFQFFSNCFS